MAGASFGRAMTGRTRLASTLSSLRGVEPGNQVFASRMFNTDDKSGIKVLQESAYSSPWVKAASTSSFETHVIRTSPMSGFLKARLGRPICGMMGVSHGMVTRPLGSYRVTNSKATISKLALYSTRSSDVNKNGELVVVDEKVPETPPPPSISDEPISNKEWRTFMQEMLSQGDRIITCLQKNHAILVKMEESSSHPTSPMPAIAKFFGFNLLKQGLARKIGFTVIMVYMIYSFHKSVSELIEKLPKK